MKKYISILVIIGIAVACNRKEALPKPFTKEILQNQLFIVNTEKDTSLQTIHGSIIRIQAGSFNVSGNVQIEIKEAFTATEILAAGLTTESNGKPLRSAGMIYINGLLNGETVQLTKPVKISMPNNYYDPQMKVFKGVESDSGTVNWVDPVLTDTTPQINNWVMGKAIFQANCKSCHNIFSDGTGPALADVEYRGPWHDRKNVYAFIKNPAKFMANDRYTQNLKAKYGSMMTGFPVLSIEGTSAILDYIKNETARPGAMQEEQQFNDSISHENARRDTANANSDPQSVLAPLCADDTIYLPLPKQNQTFFQGDSDSLMKAISLNQPEVLKPEDLEGLRTGFTDPNPTGGMYDFEIKTFGWYNIDAYVEGYAGTATVKLAAQVRVDFDITMHVYLFCPKNKMLSVGSDKQGDKYHFNKINNGIPLFINDRAILFAFGSKGTKMYYGIREFRVQGEQTVIVTVKESTEEKIRAALYSKEIEGIDLGIEKKEVKIIKGNCDTDIYEPDKTNK